MRVSRVIKFEFRGITNCAENAVVKLDLLIEIGVERSHSNDSSLFDLAQNDAITLPRRTTILDIEINGNADFTTSNRVCAPKKS